MDSKKRAVKSTATTVESRERAVEALRLRTLGHTYDEIAISLGYANRSGPQKAVENLLAAQTKAAIDEHREIGEMRLEMVHRAAVPFLDEMHGVDAVVKAGALIKETVLAHAKLRGTLAPVETKLSGGFGVTLDAIDEARAAAAANDPECSTPPTSPTSPDETSTSAPDSSPTG